MESDDILHRRYILFLPINDNTNERLWDIIGYVISENDGCTYSRFHYPAVKINGTKILGYFIGMYKTYPDEDVICIIADVEIDEETGSHEKLRSLINKMKDLGEKKVWLTYQDTMLCK